MHCIENCPVQKGCPWFFSLLVLFSAKLCLYTAILLQALKNIETLWPIHTLSQSFFLLFGVSAKMYIPSTIKTQIIILMTGVNNNGGSWVIWRHGKNNLLLFRSMVHEYCTFFFLCRFGPSRQNCNFSKSLLLLRVRLSSPHSKLTKKWGNCLFWC